MERRMFSSLTTRRPRVVLAAVVVLSALVVAACGEPAPIVRTPGSPASTSGTPNSPTQAAPNTPGAGTPRPQTGCAYQVADPGALNQALLIANAGAVICVTYDMPTTRLNVTNNNGTAQQPITLLGTGATTVKGVTVDTNNVVIEGFHLVGAEAPGASLSGNNITFRNNTVGHTSGDDRDGIRFFGNNVTISHNTISDINPEGTPAHADCMQTFATDEEHPASSNVTISFNRCERISNMCVIAEGPNSEAGDGSGVGVSRNVVFTNNYCENHATQAVFFDDIQQVKVTNNEFAGPVNHAVALQNNATAAVVNGNKLNPVIRFEVGMDDESRAGYQGPNPGGDP
jgi:parallel beta helix pectate lyase-like protein